MLSRLVLAVLAGLTWSAVAVAASDPLPRAHPADVGLSAERLQQITLAFKAEIELERLPGAVIAIARRGRLAYYEALGFRDQPGGTPMPHDALFSIASMTKPFTSVAALMLYEEGRLLLADPVGKHLPGLARKEVGSLRAASDGKTMIYAVPAKRQMTVHDLLRHTSGLTYREYERTPIDLLYPYGIPALDQGREEFLAHIAAAPLRFEPGTAWNYSLSTDVLGLLVEAVAGKPLGEVLTERLWRPLGMVDSHFVLPADKRDRQARPLPADPLTGAGQSVVHTMGEPLRFDCGGTCALSTAADYLRFAEMLRNMGTLGGTRVLSRKTVELMTANHLSEAIQANTRSALLPPGFGFGLGVAIRLGEGPAPSPGSPGEYFWAGATGTYFWVDPAEQLTVVLMTQAPGDLRVRYRNLLKSLVMQAIVE